MALNIPSKCLERSSEMEQRQPRGHSRVSVDVQWCFIRNYIADLKRESVEGELLTPRKAKDGGSVERHCRGPGNCSSPVFT